MSSVLRASSGTCRAHAAGDRRPSPGNDSGEVATQQAGRARKGFQGLTVPLTLVWVVIWNYEDYSSSLSWKNTKSSTKIYIFAESLSLGSVRKERESQGT